MSEQEPNPERIEVFTDDELINMSIEQAIASGAAIDHATARMIAAYLHSGQNSALYSLASTGAIVFEKVWPEIALVDTDGDENLARMGYFLFDYAIYHNERGPVEGWSKLWLRGDV